jgi:hypothetical protein
MATNANNNALRRTGTEGRDVNVPLVVVHTRDVRDGRELGVAGVTAKVTQKPGLWNTR